MEGVGSTGGPAGGRAGEWVCVPAVGCAVRGWPDWPERRAEIQGGFGFARCGDDLGGSIDRCGVCGYS
ncbi:hypothetical protein ABIA38_006781 [Embleya sp. AB8]